MEEQKQIRCAIYTRKSTDEGLEKEFNTLEAQREAGENFVMSMKHQGWVILPDHYDDGGFTHASLLLFAGVSIASVARRLGHASMTTTQKTYLHIIHELENKDVDIVMRSLSGLI